jgi:hypothetical protein
MRFATVGAFYARNLGIRFFGNVFPGSWRAALSSSLVTDKKIRRGIYRSVAHLRTDIASLLRCHNANLRPFRWAKSADDIFASIERFCRCNAPARLRYNHFCSGH